MQKTLSIPLPWQKRQWKHLHQLYHLGCLPHALLFVGQKGLGKQLFATAFANKVLCKHGINSGVACSHCRDCLLVAANTHPDLLTITPDTPGKGIKIEQIRQLIQRLNQTTASSCKLFIIYPAESLLISSSHALLKSLEEPTPKSLFILITDKPGLLLPTIRSRCQFIHFTPPSLAVAKTWLNGKIPDPKQIDELYYLAEGAPLQALTYAETKQLESYHRLLTSFVQLLKKEIDPIKLAENYVKTDIATLLDCLMKIVRNILKCHFLGYAAQYDKTNPLAILSNELSSVFLLRYFDKLISLQEHYTQVALNQQLLLEDLFCYWFLQGNHVDIY